MPHRTALLNPELPGLFADSVLGLYLGDLAPDVFGLGRVAHLAPGARLADDPGARLHVVLDGRLAGPQGWQGPGNHFDHDAAQAGLSAMDVPARVWSLDLHGAEFRAPSRAALRLALVGALNQAEVAEGRATPPADLPDPTTLCDQDHPEIVRIARRLRRVSPAATAEAIMLFVQKIPYRFGTWQERASDTLARGVGMCTTKANLQVALMRAARLEAGFVEFPMSTAVLGKLMPDGWLALQRAEVKHYFAAVELGGRWHAADASYDDAAIEVYALTMAATAAQVRIPRLAEGAPFAPAMLARNADLFDIKVVPHLNDEMGKKSRFQPRHFEALNTRLDRARGVGRSLAADVVATQVGDARA